MSADTLIKHFLPPHADMRRRAQASIDQHKAQQPPARGQAAKPPPKTPEQLRQRDRELGTYGEQLIERIYKNYDGQIEAWKLAFGDVVTAFARAVGNRDRTLEDAKREQESNAAFNALVFSLLLAGSMRFLGAYVQYAVVPNIQKTTPKLLGWKLNGMPVLVPESAPRFGSITASAFGGIAQDLGNTFVPLAFKVPPVPSAPDTWDGVWSLQNDFNKLIGQSKQLVLKQFGDIQAWMTDSTEFGSEWALFADGDVDRARQSIYKHIDGLRHKWAKEWEFFGKIPTQVNQKLLTDQYERSLWAGYLLARLKDVKPADLRSLSSHAPISRDYVGPRFEDAILQKLKLLNIVKPETYSEFAEQYERHVQGSPQAALDIEGRVDHYPEVERVRAWAETHLKNVRAKTEREFFPPARERTLPQL